MTTTEQPRSTRDEITVFLPVSPTIGLDHTLRDIRAEFEALLADFDDELAALGIGVAPAAPAISPAPRKRRWHR